MKENYRNHLPDLPSTIGLLVFLAIYYIKFSTYRSIHISLVDFIHDLKPLLLSLFAKL